jgi:hypothetical protein
MKQYNKLVLFLFSSPWPSIVLGCICIWWGLSFTGLKAKEWLGFLISLPFLFLPDQTVTEKKQLDQPTEEVVAANPGCTLLLAGAVMVVYGLFKLW